MVKALQDERSISFQYGSLLKAIEQGLSLLSSGAKNVKITDVAGFERSPMAVYQLLVGQCACVHADVVDAAGLASAEAA
jgi:hypothetical protein